MLDLAVAVEQHDGGARRRIGGERADEACARLRGPQRVLEGGAHEVEDVTVALGELTLGAAEPGDDRLTTLRAEADRDAVLDAGSVEQVAVQLAAGQPARLDGLGEAQRRTPAGGMRRQQRVTRRVAHDCRERAGRLGLGGDRLVADDARGELDAIPRQHVRGDEFGEPLLAPGGAARPPSGPRGARGRSGARRPRLCRRATACVTPRRYTTRLALQVLARDEHRVASPTLGPLLRSARTRQS